MKTFILILCITVWLSVGWASFVYWWTKDYNYTTREIPVSIFVSFAGPCAFFIGWSIHKELPKRTLIKKKGK